MLLSPRHSGLLAPTADRDDGKRGRPTQVDVPKETVWMYSSALYPSRHFIAMNAPALTEVLLGAQPGEQASLDLATEGVLRYLWQSAFGAMLIEVAGDDVWVNGQRVVPVAEVQQGPEQEVDGRTKTHIMR